jgi:signal transduction histidine kinase
MHGLAAVFPEAHAAFAGFLPEAERTDLLGNYLKRLCDPDPTIHMPAARAWSIYEGSCSTLLPSPDTVAGFAQDRTALGLARIEAHYFAHDLFLPEGGLLAHMHRIAHVPADIVQGRYDMVCPPVSAFDLAAAWPSARLTVIPDAGHSALEHGVRRALIAAVDTAAIRRAIINLVENSVRYAGKARIRLEQQGSRATIIVEDDGPGIPEAWLQSATDAFVRIEPSRNRTTGGHGLGLAIVAAIARIHGGALRLSNRPEGGLRAELALNMAEAG